MTTTVMTADLDPSVQRIERMRRAGAPRRATEMEAAGTFYSSCSRSKTKRSASTGTSSRAGSAPGARDDAGGVEPAERRSAGDAGAVSLDLFKLVERIAHPAIPALLDIGAPLRPRPRDHLLALDSDIAPGSLRDRAQRNRDALRVLKALEAERRPATLADRDTLARYSGRGALSRVFDWWPADLKPVAEELRALVSDDDWTTAPQSDQQFKSRFRVA